MKKIIFVMVMASIAGCDLPRTDPKEAAEDFAICQKAGMNATIHSSGEIRCIPPLQVTK